MTIPKPTSWPTMSIRVPPKRSKIPTSTPNRCSTRPTPNPGPTIPVRMYLTQMGEIPLLTRQEEISLARRIEITRAAFRRKLLECDYVIQQRRQGAQPRPPRRAAVRSHGAGLGDRPAGKGADSRPAAAQSAARSNACSSGIADDYRIATSKIAQAGQRRDGLAAAGPPPPPGRAAGRRTRPAHAADRADDHARSSEFSRRVDELKARSTITKAERGSLAERKPLVGRVPQHPPGHAGDAHQPAQPRRGTSSGSTPSTSRPSAGCRKATCGWSSRSPRSTATAA